MTENQSFGGATVAPAWLKWVAIIALVWNLLGFAAVAMDTLQAGPPLTGEQAAYAAAIPVWAKVSSWIAVGAGTAGALLLLRRQARAVGAFALSLVGLVGQDLWMFFLSDAASVFGTAPLVMQSLVAIIAVALLWLAIHARKAGWIS